LRNRDIESSVDAMAESGPTQQLAKATKKWWQRPITWLTTAVLAVGGGYATDAVVSGLKSVAPTDDLLQQVLGADAIKVADLTHIDDPFTGGWGYVVPGSADPAPVLAVDSDLATWARVNGGVDVRYSAWEVTLIGTRETPVEVVNIVPVLEGPCGPPLTGGLYSDQPQGETDKIMLDMDVTAERPTVTRLDAVGGTVKNYFSTKKITLPKGEANVLVLRGKSETLDCRWRYRLDLIADGKRATFTLSAPGGRPFEATGESSDHSVYDWVVPPAFLAFCHGRAVESGRPQIKGSEYDAYARDC
jgi:hypothetical protein